MKTKNYPCLNTRKRFYESIRVPDTVKTVRTQGDTLIVALHSWRHKVDIPDTFEGWEVKVQHVPLVFLETRDEYN